MSELIANIAGYGLFFICLIVVVFVIDWVCTSVQYLAERKRLPDLRFVKFMRYELTGWRTVLGYCVGTFIVCLLAIELQSFIVDWIYS